MVTRKISGTLAGSQKKLAQNLYKQEKIIGASAAKHVREARGAYVSRKVIVISVVLVCILLAWLVGLLPWSVAYITCGEPPITRRNELMIGAVYYKPGSEGYGLASPLFKGGYMCSDSKEYKSATPAFLR